MNRTHPRAWSCGLLFVAVFALAAPGAASAQTTAAEPAIALVAQDAWVPAGGGATLLLRGTDVPPDMALAITTHEQLQSRNAFDDTIGGANLGSTIDFFTVPFDSLPVDPGTGARVLAASLDDLNARLDTRQSGSGVFPLEVELRTPDNRRVSGFVTHVVVADVGADGALVVGRPLDVSWVWPLTADPAYLPGGSPDPAVVAELMPTGRLGRQAALIGTNPDVPLTLAPSPETLDAWSTLGAVDVDLGVGANLLRGAVPRNQVLAGPFVPLDMPSLLANGLGAPIPNQLASGVGALEDFYGTLIDTSTALPGPIDLPSLDALRDASRRRLIVPSAALTPSDEQFTPAEPSTVQLDAGDPTTALTVVTSDAGIEQLLVGDAPPALRAAHVLAALAVVAGEQPNRARGLVVVNPDRWDAPLDVALPLLAGLRGNPLVRPVTVDTLLADVAPATVDDSGTKVVRGVVPSQPPAPPVTPTRYDRALQERDAVARLFGVDDERVLVGDRALLSSLAASWSNDAGRGKATALLAGIGQSVDGFLAQIRVPAQSTVTLTSNRAEIPITFSNDTGQTVRVRVHLESNRLLFPDGAERVIELPPRNHTERIQVETRGPGTFPIGIEVTTEDGLPIQTTRLSVRSSVVSGVGIVLVIGALVFLALWWGWDIRRRRSRRARDDAPRATTPAPA